MKKTAEETIEPYLDRLRQLPFVSATNLEPAQSKDPDLDAELVVRAGEKDHRLFVEIKTARHLHRAAIEPMIQRATKVGNNPWILFAPYVPPSVASRLQEAGWNYVDRVGNTHLELDGRFVALIQGRRALPDERAERSPVGPRGRQVLFALLAKPELLNAPVRTIAEQAGVGKTVAADAMQRLATEGLLHSDGDRRTIPDHERALDLWLTIYVDSVRPRTLIGRFNAAQERGRPFEQWLEGAVQNLHECRWAYGGAAAAYRIVGHYRGDRTVLHVDGDLDRFIRQARLIPGRGGAITIFRALGPAALEGAKPRTAHPLLVYSELIASDDPRERELAPMVRDKFLRVAP